ncbi:DNA cytosine methyltransferase [Burkholderia vietnamiensis]|uniref:DNA cytosine methyltransferase n=1 Tax=Burkholderia vietnamiensis TaxID=60552 RepID=UPI001BA1A6A5|nr:DNA cytosine methyltransferase [Burkholderia vietnamiensis]MBR8083109.1 DNA cytosine methyltransferase [Burkholderia vietnamiensis]
MRHWAYYNEVDSYAAEWLRNLIRAGHIAPGEVDERSIEDVHPEDVKGFIQCHWFAGIGVWSHALRMAGWEDSRPVWTGSCPCQPFSAAGKGAGFDDERHLWPAWYWLIGERRPPVIFGEQVASSAVEPWIDLVSTDMERLDYAIGTIAFPAAGVNAPIIRERTYFCAALTNRTGLPRTVQHEAVGGEAIASAWRAIERIHAAGLWPTWLSESGTPALVDGAPSRVGRLRAYGNAINAEAATQFILAARDILN